MAKKNNITYKLINIDEIKANEFNPNKMGDDKFNLLVENIKQVGMNDPLQVVKTGGGYLIVDGEHRYQACKVMGINKVPCMVVELEKKDDIKFQNMRTILIRGKMDPQKFAKLYDDLSKKYGEEITKEMMGFVSDAEFERIYQAVKRELPEELKEKLEEAKSEIKSIDGLAQVLSSLFNKFGDTLPYNFMMFDFGGKKNIMIQCSKVLWRDVSKIAEMCKIEKKDINEVMEKLIKVEFIE